MPPPRTIGAPPTAACKLAQGSVVDAQCSLTAHKKSEHYEHSHVCRNSSRDGEDDKEQVARMVQGQPPIHFRQGCDDCHVSFKWTLSFENNILRGPKLKPRT